MNISRPYKLTGMAAAIAVVLSLSLLLLLPNTYEYNIAPFVLAQKQQKQRIFGVGAGILPNDVPTLFSFVATRNGEQSKGVSGQFECFAVMPDGKTMYVNGTVTAIDISADGHTATLTGPSVVMGFGAGKGPFKAIVTPGGSGIGTLTLTTDINGDGIQGNMADGSEGPFAEKVTKGLIQIAL